MQKLTYTDLTNQQVVDTRPQTDYQIGHLAHSLNLNIGNFKTYALNFLKTDQPLVFVTSTDLDAERDDLRDIAHEHGFTMVEGYLPIEDVPAEELVQTDLIAPKKFFKAEGDFILLDVRHPDEITRYAPEKNLVNIPLEELATSMASLDSSKKIYTLCGSGNRGTTASSFLEDNGFDTTVIQGGMKAVEALQNKE